MMDSRNRDDLRKRLKSKAMKKIEETFAGKEIHIIKAVNLLDDIDSAQNLLSESLEDWNSKKPDGAAAIAVSELTANCNALKEERKSLQEFIEKEMNLDFPNVSSVATPIIGAKLLSEAGSKKKLAFMPSSTIQLLGAEKALFLHIKKKTSPPKHGYIFNHPLIQKLTKDKRGRASRILAGKISIAAKEDYFSGKLDPKLRLEAEEKINKL